MSDGKTRDGAAHPRDFGVLRSPGSGVGRPEEEQTSVSTTQTNSGLAAGDPSGGAIALAVWLTGWPLLAVIVTGAPVALVSGRGGGAIAALSIALPTLVLVRLVDRDPPMDS